MLILTEEQINQIEFYFNKGLIISQVLLLEKFKYVDVDLKLAIKKKWRELNKARVIEKQKKPKEIKVVKEVKPKPKRKTKAELEEEEKQKKEKQVQIMNKSVEKVDKSLVNFDNRILDLTIKNARTNGGLKSFNEHLHLFQETQDNIAFLTEDLKRWQIELVRKCRLNPYGDYENEVKAFTMLAHATDKLVNSEISNAKITSMSLKHSTELSEKNIIVVKKEEKTNLDTETAEKMLQIINQMKKDE